MRRSAGLALAAVAACAPARPLTSSRLQTPTAATAIARPPVPGAPAGVTAFVDVAVVPMDTDRVLPHQTVLIRDGRVAALGPATTVTIPQGAVRIDGRDKYLMPGFGACHGHIANLFVNNMPGNLFPGGDPRYTAFTLLMLLNSGVTGLRNVDYIDRANSASHHGARFAGRGLYSRDLLWLREQAAAGRLWSPRLYVAGQWGPTQYIRRLGGRTELGDPAPRLDSVAAYVAAYKAAGYDFIKLHNESPEMADSVFAAARRVGVQVGGHVVSSFERALAGGQKVTDHNALGGWPREQDRAQIAAQAGARRRAGLWSCFGGYFDQDSLVLRALADSGAGFLIGNDGAAGLGDLPKMVKDAGLTPYQVLVGGTKNFGQYLRTLDPHGDETGTIAVGQRADLVLLSGNPLADVRYAANDSAERIMRSIKPSAENYQLFTQIDPVLVMIGGRWLRRAELNRRVAVIAQFADLLKEEQQRGGGLRGVLQTDSGTTTATRRALDRLDSLHQAERLELATRFALAPTSPAGDADSLRGPQRLAELFARQLGEVRATLPAAARESFDQHARAWLARRAADGYQVTVSGVNP